MKTNGMSVATISWARDEEEENILRASLKQLSALNLPVFITDGGSSARFLDFLHSTPHFVVQQAKGLWPQEKTSIAAAVEAGAKFILYTEPDKEEFFSIHLPRLLEASIEGDMNRVVLASRSSKSFSTFPSFQQMTETTINNCCKEVTGKVCDYCYGPFLFNSKLVPYLRVLENNIGWGWRPFLFALAHRLGFKIESYVGDFNCPLHQREDNEAERVYRMKQLVQNINGLVQAATINLQE